MLEQRQPIRLCIGIGVSNMKQFRGTVDNWTLENKTSGGIAVCGTHTETDTKIRTSAVLILDLISRKVETRNSFYDLGKMRGESVTWDATEVERLRGEWELGILSSPNRNLCRVSEV